MGDQSYPVKKSGYIIPCDPNSLLIVDAEEFRNQLIQEEGSADILVNNALLPIDWRTPLFEAARRMATGAIRFTCRLLGHCKGKV
jgi:hypothetical protein